MVRARAARAKAAAITFTAGLLFAGSDVRADGAAGGECDVTVDPRMSVYMVIVGGVPYREKRYLTWDDALRLRDVLVSAGACARVAGPKPCKLELVPAGGYAVVRDGINFDPYAKLRTREAARDYARALERVKLCKPMR